MTGVWSMCVHVIIAQCIQIRLDDSKPPFLEFDHFDSSSSAHADAPYTGNKPQVRALG